MKKIIFCLMFLLFIVKSFGQTPSSPSHSKDYYLKKSENQKTLAWVLLVGGTAMAVGGGVGIGNNEFISIDNENVSNSDGDIPFVLFSVGLIADIVSIPLFVSASKNKEMASLITFNNQNILLLRQSSWCKKLQPAITLKIAF